MNFYKVFLLSFIDMLMLIIFVSKIEIRLSYDRKIVKTAFALIGALVIGLVGVFIKNEVVGLTLNVCAAFIILKRITGFNIPQILVVYCYSLSVIYAIQIVIALAMKCFFADFSVQFTYGVIAQLCGLIVVALLARRLDLRVGYELLDSNRTIKIAGINIFIIFYLLVMKWHLDFSGFLESTIIILLILVVLFIINGLLFKELIEKKNYRDKMMVYEMYLPVIEEMINEVRSKQHDYHNHIQALECLNDKDGLAYKEKLIENITWEKLIVLENEVLMAFLYSKYSLALKEKVLINYDIKSTLSNVKCSDLDLIEMTGILIDNALEATMTMANKEFHVLLDCFDSKFIIETRNPSNYITSKEIENMFEYNFSSKDSEKRGIGLFKLKKLIGKENGSITVQYDNISEMLIFTLMFE